MWQVKKEYIGMTACLPDGQVVILKEKLSKKDMAILKKYNYEGIEKIEKSQKIDES